MKLYPVALAILSVSTMSYATDQHPNQTLARAHVKHITGEQTVNRKEIDLASLERGHTSWHITCHYKMSGKGPKTDVAFMIPGTQLINLDQDYNPYDNSGISKKTGRLHFTLDQSDLKYGKAIIIQNYDAKNDITVSNCKAIWLDG